MTVLVKMFQPSPPAELILALIQHKKKKKEHDRRMLSTSSYVSPFTRSALGLVDVGRVGG